MAEEKSSKVCPGFLFWKIRTFPTLPTPVAGLEPATF